MFKKILIFTIVFAAFTACKKDKQPSDNKSINSSTSNSLYPLSYADKFNGIFVWGHYYYEICTNTYLNNFAMVYFNSVPISTVTSEATALKVNKVYYNNDTVGYATVMNNTYQRDNLPTVSANTWSVNGANGIPSFSINVNDDLPFFTGTTPSTITISSNLVIKLNCTFTHSGFISIRDGTNNVNVTKALVPGLNTVIFTPLDMAGLQTGNLCGYLEVNVRNAKAYVIGGKNFQFNRIQDWGKKITINP